MDSPDRVIERKIRTKHWTGFVRPFIVGLLVLQGYSGTEGSPTTNASDKHKITVQAKLSHDKVKPGSACFVLLIVNIQDGWHINSATPSDENLIATSVEIQKKKVIDSLIIQYPPAEARKFEFSEDIVEVYEGTIKVFIRMEIQKSARPGTYFIPATVNYQSCSNRVCLAPTFVRVNIPIRVTTEGQMIREINQKLFEPYTLK